ncbi:MAG: tRNA (adenosine(37)-N6)-threonylcarbamoyltransferase complex ATPase subunit type 1 TsaE [Fusobacteriota bacterium]
MKKTYTLKQANELAKKISNILKPGDVVALNGNLGTGKTTFVKEIGKSLGVTKTIKSPTYTYVREYDLNGISIFHFDVYRISEPWEIYDIGYEDYLNANGIILIEWANLIESELPEKYLKINFEYNTESKRNITIDYIGDKNRKKEILKYVNSRNRDID